MTLNLTIDDTMACVEAVTAFDDGSWS